MKTTSCLPQKTLLLWQLRCGLVGVLLITGIALFCMITPWMLVPIAALAALLAVFILWFLPLYFKSYEIVLSDNAVIVNRGVFFRTSYIMPYPRLVFSSSFSSPLAKAMGLSSVTLRAARGLIVIPEMEAEDANALLTGLSGGDRP